MKLYELLDIRPGVTALIGSGGKTSLLYHLAGELSKKGSVLLTTTTHIRKPDHLPFAATAEEVAASLSTRPVVCVGTPAENGKLTAPAFDGWEKCADYVLVEADGSRMLPLKAHAEHEPVIPQGCANTICVVGASGLGQILRAVAHRPERYAQLAGCGEMTKVTAEIAARVLNAEGGFDRVFLNQTDALPRLTGRGMVKDFARAMSCPVVAGSLRQGIFYKAR